MTFIRKLMNVLDMDNWNGSESDDSMLDNDFANQYIESDDSSTDSSFSQINDVCFSTNDVRLTASCGRIQYIKLSTKKTR